MSNPTPDPSDSEENQPEHHPYPNPAIEVIELYGRLHRLRRALADLRRLYGDVTAENTYLAGHISRLTSKLTAARRTYADLVAACRAALTAHQEGEPDADAWAYIEDELPPAPPGHPLHPGGDGNPARGGR